MANLLVRTDATLRLTIGSGAVAVHIKPCENGPIAAHDWLDWMPIDFYESSGFLRQGAQGGPAEAMAITGALIPMYFAASGRLPILWVCSKRHARAQRALFHYRAVRYTILRGSARRNNPYPPLKLHDPVTGGSDDEHIVMLEEWLP